MITMNMYFTFLLASSLWIIMLGSNVSTFLSKSQHAVEAKIVIWLSFCMSVSFATISFVYFIFATNEEAIADQWNPWRLIVIFMTAIFFILIIISTFYDYQETKNNTDPSFSGEYDKTTMRISYCSLFMIFMGILAI